MRNIFQLVWRVLRPMLLLSMATLLTAQQPPDTREEPLRLDFDMESIPEPKRVDTGYAYDFMDGTVFQQFKQAFDFPRHLSSKPAYNINSLDEVPDSSWFTNRNGFRAMSLDEIRRGPDLNGGPTSDTLTVTRGKTSGISPGFYIRDARGDTYLLKFDPLDYPELATAAEVVSTKLFHAIGYNVPQNTIVHFERSQLRLDPQAEFEDKLGRTRHLTEADVDEILKLAARRSDGSYRAVASKLIPGKPKGGFSFSGRRKDDTNDIIPHEHRRDLRGLRVFAAWLEHNDIRVGNTLDTYVTEDGRGFLRHYLIDLGSTLGSDTAFPNVDVVGKEHQFDAREAGKVLVTLGLYQQPWRLEKRDLRYRSVGYYESRNFRPESWKQNFPLVAFENLTDADGWWAARIVGSFTDDQIRAAVETGQISDPEAARYLFFQIKERRDLITHYYAHRTTGLAGFRIEQQDDGARIGFEDVRKRTTGTTSDIQYELQAGGQAVAAGSTTDSSISLDRDTLTKIAAAAKPARMTLRRRGESFVSEVFIVYKNGRARITGIRHN